MPPVVVFCEEKLESRMKVQLCEVQFSSFARRSKQEVQ